MLEQAQAIIYDFYTIVKPLSIFIVAMVLYSIFVFKFYKFISKRDIFKMKDVDKGKDFTGFLKFLARLGGHTIHNLIVIPILVFFWFAIFATLIIALARNHTAETILMVSLAIVASIRVTAYYNEILAEELAKTIPLAMLAVLIVDIGYFSLDNSMTLAEQLPSHWKTLVYYLVLVVLIEFVMRVIQYIIKSRKENIEYRYSQVLK